jgi:hypothetical protein
MSAQIRMPQVPASAEMRGRRTLDFLSVSRVRRLQKHGPVRMTVEFGQPGPRSGVIPITEGNLAVMAFSYAVKLTNDAGQFCRTILYGDISI